MPLYAFGIGSSHHPILIVLHVIDGGPKVLAAVAVSINATFVWSYGPFSGLRPYRRRPAPALCRLLGFRQHAPVSTWRNGRQDVRHTISIYRERGGRMHTREVTRRGMMQSCRGVDVSSSLVKCASDRRRPVGVAITVSASRCYIISVARAK
jgi:hypothetical protein